MTLTREVPLTPAQSALIFIDVQNFSAHRDGGEFKDLSQAEFDEKYGWFFDQLEARVDPEHAGDSGGLPQGGGRGDVHDHRKPDT